MKRVVPFMTVLCLLLTAFAPLALADAALQITAVTYTSEDAYFTLTVRGMCTAGTNISLLVRNENGDLRAIEQCRAGSGDVFSKEVVIDSSNDAGLAAEDGSIVYSVYARSYYNEDAVYTLSLYSDAGKERIVSLFNAAADGETMRGCIEQYDRVFGFDRTFYSGMEPDVANWMLT